jgi:hypothetical protein
MSVVLASHGYIVVSISANGISARDNTVLDLGMDARARLIQRHLDIWNAFNTTGSAPFGNTFVGKVDLQNVGTMGHSRGGEGVVQHFIHNASLGSPYGIKAVFPLASLDFNRPVIGNVPLGVLAPYCDGDVSDLQGLHFYDDGRYNPDTAAKHSILVMGANHNFYNSVWTPGMFPVGASDDAAGFFSPTDSGCGTAARLTAPQQRRTGQAYVAGFFRLYLGSEFALSALFAGDTPPPLSAQPSRIFVSYHAPDDQDMRRDVNRLLTAGDLTTNTVGGSASQMGITPYDLCGGEAPQPQHCSPFGSPHTTPSNNPSKRGLSQLRGGWSSTYARYTNELPAGTRDVSRFQRLQFRVSVNSNDARNPVGLSRDFSVVLTDGAARSASVRVSTQSQALFYPPGNFPNDILNMARIPLASFSGIDLHDIRSVQFRFDQQTSGALLVSDISFANPSRHWSGEFDPQFYLAAYPDLQAAFGATNYRAAFDHWVSQGLPNEGRRGSREFDVQFYLATYPELQAAFGTDFRAALDHWVSQGLPTEGRRGSREFDVAYHLATSTRSRASTSRQPWRRPRPSPSPSRVISGCWVSIVCSVATARARRMSRTSWMASRQRSWRRTHRIWWTTTRRTTRRRRAIRARPTAIRTGTNTRIRTPRWSSTRASYEWDCNTWRPTAPSTSGTPPGGRSWSRRRGSSAGSWCTRR